MDFALILLAAGKAERFGESKLETHLKDRMIIEYILSNIPTDCFSKMVIVAANENILNEAKKYGIDGIINDRPELGIARSVKMGTEYVKEADAYMYCVSDQPMLKKSTIIDMIASYKEGSILALSNKGRRGNPVISPSFLYDELTSLAVDESGQKVIKNHMDILMLHETENKEQLLDIDTKGDLEEIKKLID